MLVGPASCIVRRVMPGFAIDTPPQAKTIAQLATRGPRYTSYPAAPCFNTNFLAKDAEAELQRQRASAQEQGISLYTHIPFCKSLCWYCGCNVKITRNRDQGVEYVATMLQEVRLYRELMGEVGLAELSLGGGSPNFLGLETLTELTRVICELFPPRDDSMLGIELDPRDTTSEQVACLASLGYRRLSVGVQDFNAEVQATINRFQTAEQTNELIVHARVSGFTSVGVDLVYGLPGQTTKSFAETLGAVVDMNPDRIALFGYAHLPHLRKHQLLVERKAIPNLDHRATLLCTAIEILTGRGYQRVGFDHFARPSDPLAIAARNHTLHRNFQGFTIARGGPLLACGVTGISDVGQAYWQNHSEIPAWRADVEAGLLPVARGIALTQDDIIRRSVIYQIMCSGALVYDEVDSAHAIDSRSYFADEFTTLEGENLAPLVNIDATGLKLTDLGFELVRNVCMVFDAHLRGKEPSGSTTI